MQFMVRSRRRLEQFATEDFDAVIPAETDRIRELYAEGVVRQIWLRSDEPGAYFLMEAADEKRAHEIVHALPMASSGLSEFTISPLQPYRGFGRG